MTLRPIRGHHENRAGIFRLMHQSLDDRVGCMVAGRKQNLDVGRFLCEVGERTLAVEYDGDFLRKSIRNVLDIPQEPSPGNREFGFVF